MIRRLLGCILLVVALPGGALAQGVAGKPGLHTFGATTSAQFRSVLTDPTGTGPAVFATSPTLSTPKIGATTFTGVGAYTATLTFTGTTGVTFPTSGTLATTTNLASYLPLAGGTLTGDFLFTDATYDIGKSGATRPRDGFFSRNVVVGGNVGFNNKLLLSSPSDGNLLMTNWAGTGFNLLQFGCATSSCVALKRNGTQLEARVGDDTNDVVFVARQFRMRAAQTISSLGTPSGQGAGTIAYVTDLTSTTRGATAAGGGSSKGIVWSDGTNWLVM